MNERTDAKKLSVLRNKNFWLIVVWVLAALIWFMPTPEGLTLAGQHAMAVVVFTIGMWLVKAVSPGCTSIIMIGIVTVLMRDELSANTLLSYWTKDTIWFIIISFAFAPVMKKTGLGNRLASLIFSIKNPLMLNFSILVISFIFSLVGMATALPKLALLFPLLVSIATLSGLDKENRNVRRLALMINILTSSTGVLLYTGFSINTMLAPLGGFETNYMLWLKEVSPMAVAGNLLLFFIIYFMYMPKKGEASFDYEKVETLRKKMGHISVLEIKAIIWFIIAIDLWATGGMTGIAAGYATLLVVGLMCLPIIGVMTFKDALDSISWPTTFMIMGVLAFGALGSTGFTKWIVGKILPSSLPSSPLICLLLVCFAIEVLHIVMGSVATSMALMVPILVTIAPNLGVSGKCISLVCYCVLMFQAFFPYQNVAFVAGQSYDLWEEKDLLMIGIVSFILVPILFAVVLYPFYDFMGWIL